MIRKPRVAFHTLGCKVNQNETDALAAVFLENDYEIVDFEEAADVYVINTCTVTHLADRKSRHYIRRPKKINPEARVVVMGCYAQAEQEKVAAIPGVSLVVGSSQKNKIVRWLAENPKEAGPAIRVSDIRKTKVFEETGGVSFSNRSRAYLKIQEGCEQFCSYCIIPYVRGPVRSRTEENTLSEARKLIAAGFREIVLTGIHLGAYGQDRECFRPFEKLLAELLRLDSAVRWRLSSLEPTEVSPELIELMVRYSNFCPHLHLPLQSGHDKVLQAMYRPYSAGQYSEIISLLRSRIPQIAITTDIMVGFPGETEGHFEACLSFVQQSAFSALHVFQYSPRAGTPAAQFAGQVPAEEKARRSRILIERGQLLAHDYAAGFVGSTLQVLAETDLGQGWFEGKSENYLTVRFKAASVARGSIVPIKIRDVTTAICYGDYSR